MTRKWFNTGEKKQEWPPESFETKNPPKDGTIIIGVWEAGARIVFWQDGGWHSVGGTGGSRSSGYCWPSNPTSWSPLFDEEG